MSGETTSEVETPEAKAAAQITSGRSPTPTPRAIGSQCEVCIDPDGMTPGEGLADASVAASTSHGPDKRYTALSAGEAKRVAEYIPGPPRFSLRDHTADYRCPRSDVVRGRVGDYTGRGRGDHAQGGVHGRCMGVYRDAQGKIQDLPPPPTTQAKLLRPPFRKAFELSQRVEIKGLLDVGCFAPVGREKDPKGRKIVASKWLHTYKGNKQGYRVKKGFGQVSGVDYNETTSPTPAAAPSR